MEYLKRVKMGNLTYKKIVSKYMLSYRLLFYIITININSFS